MAAPGKYDVLAPVDTSVETIWSLDLNCTHTVKQVWGKKVTFVNVVAER